MADAFEDRLRSLRRLIKTYDNEIVRLDARIVGVFKGHPGYETIQQIHGVGPVFAAIFVAEIGDVTRFDNARQISSWAGMTPRHRESDVKAHRGAITKQGPRLVRWAAVEAVSRNHKIEPIHDIYVRVGQRRGVNKGRVAAARKLLTLVFYGLRDRGSMPRHRCTRQQKLRDPGGRGQVSACSVSAGLPPGTADYVIEPSNWPWPDGSMPPPHHVRVRGEGMAEHPTGRAART